MDITIAKPRNVIEEFLANLTNPSTKRAYETDLKQFFNHFQGAFSHPAEIQVTHLIAYRNHLINKNLSSSSINRKMAAVKGLLSWCVEIELITSNPANNIRLPKVRTVTPTVAFSDEEAISLIMAPDTTTFYGNYHKIVFLLLLTLGLRRSELVNIKLKDIYEDRGSKILRIVGKGDKERLLPLPDSIVEALEVYLENYRSFTQNLLKSDDFLIQSNPEAVLSSPVNPATIFKLVRRYASKLNINKRVSPHSCRATVISHLLEKNISPRDVADMAGHSNIQTTIGIYDKKRLGVQGSPVYKVKYGSV